jgi:glycosyltransferase involved in cell wall biosynthesis
VPYSVSVLITNYNYARFLPMAIDSVLAQTVSPLEILVVDDGSTDGSLQVLHEHYADHVRLIAKPNGGQASAFNVGFSHCRGDLVALLDADDVWEETKLQHVTAAFDRHPAAAMLRHELRFDQPGAAHHGEPVLGLRDQVRRTTNPRRTLVDRAHAPTSALVFPRWVLDRLMPLPEAAFRICADGALYVRAPGLGEVIDLALPLADYRVHGSNNFAGGDAESAARSLRVELELVSLLESDGIDPIVPHYVYRAVRRGGGPGLELLANRPRLKRAVHAAVGMGNPSRRLAHAAAELLGRVESDKSAA